MEFDTASTISAFALLFICLLIWAITTWRELHYAKKLKDFVAWSVLESDGIRYNIPLWAHLNNAQIHANIRDEYRIYGDEEWEAAKGIIARYQKNLAKSYFDGILWVPKSIHVVQNEDYFVYMLYVYLCEHMISGRDVVFHKMHYITYMYCKESMSLKKNVPAWNESVLKEALDDVLREKRNSSNTIPVLSNSRLKINFRDTT